jgi:hypothetical protein
MTGKEVLREIDAVFEAAEELLEAGYKVKTVRKALIAPLFRALKQKLISADRGGENMKRTAGEGK